MFSLDSCLFSMEYSDGKGDERAPGELGRGSTIKIYCMKKNLLSKEEK